MQEGVAPSPVAIESDYDPTWNRIGRVAGYTAAAALLGQTLLFLADASHLLGHGPQFHRTAAGVLQDIANYYAAFFNHQHHIVWDIALRDSLGPVGWVALVIVALALANLVGRRGAMVQLMAAFIILGAVFEALEDLTYLSLTNYWRHSGWISTPATNMVAVGRAAESIDNLTTYFQDAGFVLLAVGLFYLARLCRTDPRLPSRLTVLSYAVSLGALGAAMSSVLQNDNAFNILGLLVGAVLGPVLLVWLAWDFGRLAASPRHGPVAAEPGD